MEDLRFPIGPFAPVDLTPDVRTGCLEAIRQLPAALQDAVADLGEAQLNTRYRPDGWTVRQVVHHLADSHMNAWCRMRLTVTEERPTIRAYDEKAWAELSDSRTMSLGASMMLLDGLHRRWVRFLESLDESAWDRAFDHPEAGPQTLGWLLQMYAWHGRHHVAHITRLRERRGW